MSKISFTAKAGADNKKLTVSCAITNETGKKIYLFDALWTVDKEGKTVPDPHRAYASIDEKKVLHLGKIVHPLPKDKVVEQRIVPFAILVEAGAKWQQDITFEMPVEEYNPYYVASEKTLWDEVAIGSVRVCIDWVAEVEGLKLHDNPIKGSFRLEHRELLKLVQRASSAELPIKAQGLRRVDKFERFSC